MIWLLLAIIQEAFIVLNMAFAWLIACFVNVDGNLPKWLSWCQTPDSNMFGANGDRGFRDRNAHLLGTWIGRWWVCVKWIWRNTANGFREYVMGFAPPDDCKTVQLLKSSDRYEFEMTFAARNTDKWWKAVLSPIFGTAWQLYFVWYWNDKKRFRLNAGWKLWNMSRREKSMIVFSISPYMNR